MPSFNRLILAGHLTRDPQLKHLPGDKIVTEFGIATNRKWGDREEVMFLDCSAFGKTAEVIAEHFVKGKPILIEGRLKQDTWEDKQGQKRSKHTCVVDQFSFLGDGGGQGSRAPATPAAPPFSEQQQFEKADIPF